MYVSLLEGAMSNMPVDHSLSQLVAIGIEVDGGLTKLIPTLEERNEGADVVYFGQRVLP